MFFSYSASVVLVSLALYGIYCLVMEYWNWYVKPRLIPVPSVSLLLIVRDLEYDIEGLLRSLLQTIERSQVECEIVVAEMGSQDFTPRILRYLADDYPQLTVLFMEPHERPALAALPACQGDVVYLLDLANRLNPQQCEAAVNHLLDPL